MLTRMQKHQPTRDYIAKRSADGKTMGEIARMLRRYIAREIYKTLPRATDPPLEPGSGPQEPAHTPRGCARNDLPIRARQRAITPAVTLTA
jgi:hypothetical protein